MAELSRRGFLGSLIAGAAGTALAVNFDPERLLWVPGAKTFFLPDQSIVVAKSLTEAFTGGLLTARFPGGWVQQGRVANEQDAKLWIQNVKSAGGTFISGYKEHKISDGS